MFRKENEKKKMPKNSPGRSPGALFRFLVLRNKRTSNDCCCCCCGCTTKERGGIRTLGISSLHSPYGQQQKLKLCQARGQNRTTHAKGK